MDKNIETYVKQLVSKLVCSKDDKNDIAEEMKDHLYLLKNEYLQKGFTDEVATQKALQDFGNENNIQSGLQNTLFPIYKLFRLFTWIFFGVYSFIILTILFLNRIIWRIIHNGEIFSSHFHTWGGEHSTLELWNFNSNWVPLRQISEYIFRSHLFNTDIVIRNLFGTMIIFIPLGIFLPILFKKCRKVGNVALATICISFTIQISRLLLMVGRFDIDDIILHTTGSLIGYLILKLLWKTSNILVGISFKKRLIRK